MTALYLHIPFCRKKCLYCDFNSSANLDRKEEYLEALKKEASLYKEDFKDRKISTIYLGGGTPSLLSNEDLEDLFTYIRKVFDLSDLVEWTMEVNPESGRFLDFKGLKHLGLTRVSMGIQTFQEDQLETLGRIHRPEDVYACIEKIKEGGIEDINGDFMFSFPGQTLESLEMDLKEVERLALNHLSYYSFIPEEGTPLGNKVLEGGLETDEILDRKMEHRIEEKLRDLGYRQYEISNFTRTKPCLHNLSYWRIRDYLGLGLSAHSSLAEKRFENTPSLKDYLDRVQQGKKPILQEEVISGEDRLLEYLIMGLRLNEGLAVKAIEDRFSLNFEKTFHRALDKNIKAGTLAYNKGSYSLTPYGRDVANQVELDFYRTNFELS